MTLRSYYFTIILITFLPLVLAAGHAGNKYIIQGKILDEHRRPLPGVNIIVVDKNIGTTTDKTGKYRLELLTRSKRKIAFKFIGYHTEYREIDFSRVNRIKLNLTMQPDILEMKAIQVTENKYEAEAGQFEMKIPELRTIPGFYADALQSVKTLPGIGSNNELSSSFHVHGGSGNDNLILLEGIYLPQPRQIRNSYQEGMSLINPALLENMRILTGGFSARYGEKLHSVLLADYRQTSPKPFRGEAEISLINAGMMFEKNLKNSDYWAIASRWTNTSFILNTLQKKGDFRPRFFDVQTLWRHQLTAKTRLSLFAFFLKNDFQFQPASFSAQYGGAFFFNEFTTHFQGDEKALFTASILSLNLKSQLSSAFVMSNIITFSDTKEDDQVNLTGNTVQRMDVDYFTKEAGSEQFFQIQQEYRNNRLREKRLSSKNSIKWIQPRHIFQFGSDIHLHSFQDQLAERFSVSVESNQDSVEAKAETRAISSSTKMDNYAYIFFAEDEWQLTPALSINYGLRSHYFTYNQQLNLSPRLRFKWAFAPRTWLSCTTGHYSQPPEYRELRDENYNLISKVTSQTARKTILSLYHQNRNQAEFRAEAYYVTLPQLIPYKFEDIFIQYQPEFKATGRSYGLTFYLYGKFNQRLNSWFSYQYMVARQKIPELGGNFPSPTDQRHTVSIVFQDDMPDFPSMQAHTRILFGSGYPFDAYTAHEDPESGIYYAVEHQRNSLRKAYYRRIDVGFSYKRRLSEQYLLKIAFEIFNIFDFRNVLSYKIFTLQDGNIQRVRNNLSRRIVNFRLVFSF